MKDFSNGGNQPDGDILRVRNSIIEEIRMDKDIGFVTISFEIMGDSNTIYKQLLTLVVCPDTIIQDRFGQSLSLSDLSKGMIVDAEFSPVMTRSFPPQSRAYRIIVFKKNTDSNITTGRVLAIDLRNGFLYTGDVHDLSNQMRFVITNSTVFFDKNGNQISLRDIRTGQRVKVEHAIFQTPSIPPQTTAFVVQII